MSYRAIYAYAWDIAEVGTAAFADEVRGLGLDTVTLAGSYHAGKFLRPHGKSGKVHFLEDGTTYFRFDPKRYGRVKPVPNSLNAEHDLFRSLADTGLAVNAWMVLMHNTRLGEAYPDCTVQNAFGDRYVYSLCPSNPDAREYAVALCKDITDNYPVMGISLETPGFLPYVHGFHHEFALMKQNRWLEANLGLCFCEHCVRSAEAAGIEDVDELREQIRTDVELYLSSDLDLPDDMAEAFWIADIQTDGRLSDFLRLRCARVASLVMEIRAAVRNDATVAVIPSVARPTGGAWYEGSDIPSLVGAAGIIEACFYEPSPARIRADIWDVQRRIAIGGRLRGILRPAHPDLNGRDAVVAAALVMREAGIAEIAFYNYGHLRRASLGWIADALKALGS
jgi:hypothetical protein